MEKQKPQKILFVCLGNICRSPAAEGIFNTLVATRGVASDFEADSAGTYGGHSGSLPDARMRRAATERGYTLTHRSRRVCSDDFERFDRILAMDDANYYELCALAPTPELEQKVERVVDYCRYITATHVPDPYYGGVRGFEEVLDLLEDACAGLLDCLSQDNKIK